MEGEEGAVQPEGFQRWVPGVPMLRTYRRSWFRFDLVSGVVLAAILVPQGMAYAELAGLPAVTGLYTTIACLIGYALFGPSRILVLGPDSSVAPLIFAAIVPLLVTGDPAEAVALAGMMALLVGAIEVGLGLGKLGFVADLLSKEVQVGYMNGLAVTILVGQLPKLFGFSTDADGFIQECKAFVQGLDARNATALAIGIATLAVLLILPRVSRRVPAVLVAVVGATIATAVFDLAARGVDTVGALPQGLPAPTFPSVPLDTMGALLVAALGIVLVSLTDTIATSTSFAARRGDEVDPDQEMIGMGAANIFAGFFQGFAISASGSRTAVAEQSGSKSQVTGLAGAAIVALLLLFWPSLLQDLPQPALAAVVIAAALSLFNVAILRTYFRMRRSALVISLIASARRDPVRRPRGHPDRDRAVDLPVLPAQLVARRRGIGSCARARGWHRTDLFPDAEEIDRVLIFRWEAPLFFANAGIFRQEIRRLVRRRDPRWVVLQCEAITDIDVTAADMLDQLDKELNDKGVNVVFVEMRTRIQDLLERYGLFATFTREHVYPSIALALRGIEEEERQARAVDTAAISEDPADPAGT